MTDVVITGAARSAMGGFQGMFSDLTAADLGGAAIRIKNGNLKVAAEHALPAEQVNAIPARLSAMVTACSAAYEIKCPRRS
mgnify:CR=1 FL=1